MPTTTMHEMRYLGKVCVKPDGHTGRHVSAEAAERHRQWQRRWYARLTPKEQEHEQARRRAWYARLTPQQKRKRQLIAAGMTPERLERRNQRAREVHLKATYQLTGEDYQRLLAEQSGRCAICGTDQPSTRPGRHFDIDHNHTTGEVRGLLCINCNGILGRAGDDPSVLETAAQYLRTKGRA